MGSWPGRSCRAPATGSGRRTEKPLSRRSDPPDPSRRTRRSPARPPPAATSRPRRDRLTRGPRRGSDRQQDRRAGMPTPPPGCRAPPSPSAGPGAPSRPHRPCAAAVPAAASRTGRHEAWSSPRRALSPHPLRGKRAPSRPRPSPPARTASPRAQTHPHPGGGTGPPPHRSATGPHRARKPAAPPDRGSRSAARRLAHGRPRSMSARPPHRRRRASIRSGSPRARDGRRTFEAPSAPASLEPANSSAWQTRKPLPTPSARSRAASRAAGSISPSGSRSAIARPSETNFGCQAMRCLLCGRSTRLGYEMKEMYFST